MLETSCDRSVLRARAVIAAVAITLAACSSDEDQGSSGLSGTGGSAGAMLGTSGDGAGGTAAGAGGVAGSIGGASGSAGMSNAGAAGTSGVGGASGGAAGTTGGTGGVPGEGGASGAAMPDAGSDDPDAFAEDRRSECSIPSMPAVSSLPSIAALPDPFTMLDGTPVTTKAQWKCRREELGAILEHYELGEKPRQPERVTGSLSGETLTITVADKGETISFTVRIDKPSGAGPFPAIIGYGSVSLGDALSGLDVATIAYTAADIFNASAPNQMAKDGSTYRGQGLFYDLYGSDHSAGALMAWAWGVSRILDVLVAMPELGIDAKRVAVTGCSRFGKGALVAGAFDQRIALTLPNEGGSGGCSAWRGIAYMKSLGNDIEQLSNVAGGTNWYRASFASSFSNATIDTIPFDHHELAGMIAPRALLNLEQDGIAWLGPGATHINNVGAREIFTALGAADAHTYSLSTGHEHCMVPSSHFHWIASYVKKYLLVQEGEPSAIETPPGYTFDRAKWIDWSTPTLE